LNTEIFKECLSNISELELGRVQLKYHGECDIPNLMTIYEIIHPVNIAHSSINRNINELKNDNLGECAVSGLLALGISNLETMLSDLLKKHLSFYPNKLSLLKSETSTKNEKGAFRVSKDTLNSGKIIEGVITKEVDKILYGNIKSLFKVFYKILALKDEKMKENTLHQLIEIKERRNLLLHNNLYVNEQYIYKTKDLKKETKIKKRLTIGVKYAIDSLSLIYSIIEDIKQKILDKYSKFTLLHMLKGVWKYTFKDHIKFEDHFVLNDEKDIFDGTFKESKYSLSSSEIFLMQLWKAQRFGSGIDNFALVHFSENNVAKIAFLVELFGNMRLTYWYR